MNRHQHCPPIPSQPPFSPHPSHPHTPNPANAQDYQALLSRHQQAEAGLARAREAASDMRARLEAITGPQGPQARLRQMEAQLAQVSVLGGVVQHGKTVRSLSCIYVARSMLQRW